MLTLLKFGAGLYEYWWVVLALLALAFAFGAYKIGTGVFDAIKAVATFFTTPAGQILAIVIAIYAAGSYGYSVADSHCSTRIEAVIDAAEEDAAERDRTIKSELESKYASVAAQNETLAAERDEAVRDYAKSVMAKNDQGTRCKLSADALRVRARRK